METGRLSSRKTTALMFQKERLFSKRRRNLRYNVSRSAYPTWHHYATPFGWIASQPSGGPRTFLSNTFSVYVPRCEFPCKFTSQGCMSWYTKPKAFVHCPCIRCRRKTYRPKNIVSVWRQSRATYFAAFLCIDQWSSSVTHFLFKCPAVNKACVHWPWNGNM